MTRPFFRHRNPSGDLLYTMPEVAEMIGLEHSALRRAILDGRVPTPAIRRNKMMLFTQCEIDRIKELRR